MVLMESFLEAALISVITLAFVDQALCRGKIEITLIHLITRISLHLITQAESSSNCVENLETHACHVAVVTMTKNRLVGRLAGAPVLQSFCAGALNWSDAFLETEFFYLCL